MPGAPGNARGIPRGGEQRPNDRWEVRTTATRSAHDGSSGPPIATGALLRQPTFADAAEIAPSRREDAAADEQERDDRNRNRDPGCQRHATTMTRSAG